MGKNAWRKLFLYGMLELGAVCGVPIRPDEIERLSRLMNGTAVVEVAGRTDDGEPPEGAAGTEAAARSSKLSP